MANKYGKRNRTYKIVFYLMIWERKLKKFKRHKTLLRSLFVIIMSF